jgi:argininosuccinate lyase
LTDASFTEARLGEAPDDVNQRYILTPTLDSELGMVDTFIQVDLAHAVMLVERGVIPAAEGARLLSALQALADMPDQLEIDPSYDTLLLQIERHLAGVVGADLAGRLHTGRSRNDQGSTVKRIHSRNELLAIAEGLAALQQVMLALAGRHLKTTMPGYTHLQHAQPVTFAHWLMRHCSGFERDQSRLEAAFSRVNVSALGLAAMAGTSWPLDRERTAQLLGHEGLVRNGQDCGIFNIDYPAEVAATLSIMVANQARMATDLYLWSTHEFGMVEIPDGLAGTSSIMPQKKNPHSLERILALGGVSIGWLPAILATLRGSSASDLSLAFAASQTPHIYQATRETLKLSAATMEGLTVKADVMARLAGASWSTASNLADTLVRSSGISFRAAHQVVGRVVRRAIERKLSPTQIGSAEIAEASREILGEALSLEDQAVRDALDTEAFINSRVTLGSPRPDDVEAHVREASAQQEEHRGWLAQKTELVSRARSSLRDAVGAIVDAAPPAAEPAEVDV